MPTRSSILAALRLVALFCSLALVGAVHSEAAGFQAPDLAEVGKPFSIKLPEGSHEVNWGDGTKNIVSSGVASHFYRKSASLELSVREVKGDRLTPVPWDYVALVRESSPVLFLDKPESPSEVGPSEHLPRAARLDGTSRKLFLPSPCVADSFSVEAWVRLDGLGGRQIAAEGRSADALGFRLGFDSDGLFFELPAGRFSAPLAGSFEPGPWRHVAVTYDRVPLFPLGNKVRVFIDGVPMGEGTIPAEDAGPVRCDRVVLGGEGFRGEAAGFAIYDRLLFPLAIWDRVQAVAAPFVRTVTVAYPGAGKVVVAEPRIMRTVDVPMDSNPAADNGPVLRAAIRAAEPGTRLRLVDAKTDTAGEKFFVRSLVAAPQWAALPIEDKKDFELDGNGATLVFSDSVARYVLINRCTRLALRNLSFDLDPAYARVGLYAKLLEIDRSTGKVTAQLVNGRDGSPDPLIPRRASYWRWRPHRSDTLRLNDESAKFQAGSYASKPQPDGSGRPGVIAFRLKEKPENELWDRLEKYMAGDNFYTINNGDFSSNAVSLMFSEDVTFERVNYYATLGMVFLSSDIRRVRVASCVIGLPPGLTAADRPFSAGADGYHFHLVQGDILFENNEIALTDDDPISLKDSIWTKIALVNERTLETGGKGIKQGDPVELLAPDYSPIGYRAKVLSVDGSKVRLDARLPAKLKPGTVLMNRRHHTWNWIIRNNYFHDYYGRVMLYTDFGTVTGNRVHDSLYHIGLSTAYFEVAGVARNVITHRNLFDNTDADTANWGGNEKIAVFHQITYSANSFLGRMLRINQVADGLMCRNAFYQPHLGPSERVFSIKGSRNVLLSNNLQFAPGVSDFRLADERNLNLVQRGNQAIPVPVPTPAATAAP